MVPGLFGRTREIDELTSLVEDGSSTLVTLWGPPGIGKTTLARALLERTRHERIFVDLSEARTDAEVTAALAEALGVDAGTTAPRAGRALAARGEALLILDEAERALDPVRRQVLLLRGLAPRARLLVTSRAPLGVAAETLVEVGPLELPGGENEGRSTASVRMLLARVRALRPGFDADDSILERIVRHLDGIPLAIELSAARLLALSAAELEAELARSSYPALAQALERSWSALQPREREVLACASVFRGGFDRRAARAVCGATDDVLAALRRAALMKVRPGADPPRFDLLTPVRDFAEAQLGSRRAGALADHARHFVDPDTAPEVENLRAAAMRDVDPELRVAALVRLEPLLVDRGEATSLLELAKALPHDHRAREVEAAARFALGQLSPALAMARSDVLRARILQALGRDEEARASALKARTAADREGRPADAARATGVLAVIAHLHGDLEEAEARYAEALDAQRRAGDIPGEIGTRLRRAFLLIDRGQAAVAVEELTALASMPLERPQEGLRLGYLGNARRQLGQGTAAIVLYDRAIELLEQVDERRYATTFRMDRGIALLLQGSSSAAEELETSARLAEEMGSPLLQALALGYLVVARARSSQNRAGEILARARTVEAAPAVRQLLELHGAHLLLPAGVESARAALRAPGAGPPEHARIARLLLSRAIDTAAPPDDALVLRGTRIRPPGGSWIELGQKAAALRIVRALALGSPLGTAELAAAGWPGEKMLAAAAANRVRVALSTLRGLGLRELIRRTRAGYVIAAPVVDQS